MPPTVPLEQLLDLARVIAALTAERDRLKAEGERLSLGLVRMQKIAAAVNADLRARTAERDGLKTTLEMWAAECGEGGPRPIKAEVDRLQHNCEAYRGALGYSVPGSHDGLLRDGTLPINGIAETLTAEVERLREEITWIRKKVGLPEDTPLFSGSGLTLAGKMHNLCFDAHGYQAYIEAYKCDDKQGEIARRTRKLIAAEADVKALTEALRDVEGELLYSPVLLCAQCLEGSRCEATPTCALRDGTHARALRLVRAALARPGVAAAGKER